MRKMGMSNKKKKKKNKGKVESANLNHYTMPKNVFLVVKKR